MQVFSSSMNVINRAGGAMSAAVSAFMNYYSPNSVAALNFPHYYSRRDQYSIWWAYYQNTIFDRTQRHWVDYCRRNNLYRNIRSIYNPVRRLVDFYGAAIYPGVLSDDGLELPEGVQLAVPFPDDMDPNLKMAIAQFWQWSNWQSKKRVIPVWGAAYGSVLVELVDDITKGTVYGEPVRPELVAGLNLDAQGNVKGYTLMFRAFDANGQPYNHQKVVDGDYITHYRDTVIISQDENPYGFCPAVWINHSDDGSPWGPPAFQGSYSKLNELNSRASQINDHIGKVIAAPSIITGGQVNGASVIAKLFDKLKRPPTDDFNPSDIDQQSLPIMTAPEGTDVKFLSGNLNIKDSFESVDRMLTEIAADNPEITFWDKLREMSQVTGPAAQQLSGDVMARVQDAASQYDRGSIAIFQMALAISGMRYKEGRDGWANRTSQQYKFKFYDLESYRQGDLDFSIVPRPLIQPTRGQISAERQAFWTAIKAGVDAGVPLETVLKEEGWDDKKLAELGQADQQQLARIQTRQQLTTQQDTVPNQLPPGRVQ